MARKNSATRTDLQGNLMNGVMSVMARVDREASISGSIHDNHFSGLLFNPVKQVRSPVVRKASRSTSE